MVSNVLEKSTNVAIVISPLIIALTVSSRNLTSSVEVECFVLKPNDVDC